MPFGLQTFDNSSTLGYFNSSQALADYGSYSQILRGTFQQKIALSLLLEDYMVEASQLSSRVLLIIR